MREIRFDSAFMFAYSERDLTFAAKKLPDDVSEATKKQRLAEIVALQEKISTEVFAAHIGRRRARARARARASATRRSLSKPRTDGFKSVILPAGVGEIGGLVDVVIARATMATLFAGDVVEAKRPYPHPGYGRLQIRGSSVRASLRQARAHAGLHAARTDAQATSRSARIGQKIGPRSNSHARTPKPVPLPKLLAIPIGTMIAGMMLTTGRM